MARVMSLEQAQDAHGMEREWCYNALDCTGTREVWDALHPRLNPGQALIYAFERALQAPCMSMMRRGIKVDLMARNDAIRQQKRELEREEAAVAKREDIAKVWHLTEKETGECSARPGKKHRWYPKGAPDAERACADCSTPRLRPKPFNCNSRQQVEHLFHDCLGIPHYKNKKGEVS